MSGNSECQFYVWAILVFLGLALVISLIFNISHYVEERRKDKEYRFSNDYIPREDEYYIEDTPIYGNLDNVVPEQTVDENCYEQMKAPPQRSVNKLIEVPPAQVTSEPEMFYASLDHSQEKKRRKPKKQNSYLSDKTEDQHLHAVHASVSQTTLVDTLPSENQTEDESIHDDPIRLFGLIRGKKELLTN
ncbi:T-cell receptor-associated transmembrane adapter 1 [Erinaceus europaeus]|uniref:T-cell receptor-associated transmembrane adapter 1 n=1 Tax=Erinaceus europaeus TaxID=9365 RepID=UPI0028FC9A85|nr:T-cell receptor-associated transmembrane adapter 1 [Erinaceus europaeus]